MNPDKVIDEYCKGRTIKDLAIKYDVNQSVIRDILKVQREETRLYTKMLGEIARSLPRHKDHEADAKWEAALGQGAFN